MIHDVFHTHGTSQLGLVTFQVLNGQHEASGYHTEKLSTRQTKKPQGEGREAVTE